MPRDINKILVFNRKPAGWSMTSLIKCRLLEKESKANKRRLHSGVDDDHSLNSLALTTHTRLH